MRDWAGRCHKNIRVAALTARIAARSGSVRFGLLEQALLFAIVLLGAGYPILREDYPAAVRILCGLPLPNGTAQTHIALVGKLVCAVILAIALPLAARACAGSWFALTRISMLSAALVAAVSVTVTLTAYDACTGFHATERTSEGCACWLTALLAGLAALAVLLFIIAGRAIVAFLRLAITAIIDAVVHIRRYATTPFVRHLPLVSAPVGGVLLAYRFAGRGPPRFIGWSSPVA